MNLRAALRASCLIGLAVAGGGSGAWAQTPGAMMRLRGRIAAVSGDTIRLTLRDGGTARVMLSPKATILYLSKVQPGQIRQGSYVGTAAMTQPDGSLKAQEVQVFPPAMRGVGAGTRPWDSGTGSSMTNGTVGKMVVSHGRILTITYPGGQKTVLVPADVPVVTYAPAGRAALRRGANVLIGGTQAAGGEVTALLVSVGKDGLVPPM